MIRSLLFVGALACALGVVGEAHATTLNVNLDLQFNDPADMNSGGNWTVSALAGDFGLAGIVFEVLPANFTGDFLISNTIFEVQNFLPIGGGMGFEIVAGDDLATPTLNVGVGGSGVDLAVGTFDTGDLPALTLVGANLFNASGAAEGVSGQNLTSSVTSNAVPEPATLALLGMGLIGLATTVRRSS